MIDSTDINNVIKLVKGSLQINNFSEKILQKTVSELYQDMRRNPMWGKERIYILHEGSKLW